MCIELRYEFETKLNFFEILWYKKIIYSSAN